MMVKHHLRMKIPSKMAGLVWVIVLGLFLTNCRGTSQDKVFTIGVISYVSILDPVIKGFRAGMADLGYVEGDNLIYIYNGVVASNEEAVDNEIEQLLKRDIDLLFSIGNMATLRAKHAVKGTGIPIVFGAVTKPEEDGIVGSILHPGGNLTGTQAGGQIPKSLEWLITIVPKARKIYVPYNYADEVSNVTLAWLAKTESQLGVELVLDKVKTVEEAVFAINNLPEDIDAIFRIPSPTLDPRNSELSRAAVKRRLPMGACVPLDDAVLITFAADLYATGKQTARLAHQIRLGTNPADLPIETGETFFTVNLKTAKAIGIDIPDEILIHADKIIR